MPDSADDLLARARQAVRDWGDAPYLDAEAGDRLSAAFTLLDALLSSGGPLPTAWAAPVAELRRVTDVPPGTGTLTAPDGTELTVSNPYGHPVDGVPLPRRVPGATLPPAMRGKHHRTEGGT